MDSRGAAEGQRVQQAPPPEAATLPRALPPPLAPAPDTAAAVAAAQPDAAAPPAPVPAEAMETDQPSAAALPPLSDVPAPHSPVATHVAQQSGSVAMRAPESPSAVVHIERADSPGAPPADPAASLREHLGALQARLAKPHTKCANLVPVLHRSWISECTAMLKHTLPGDILQSWCRGSGVSREDSRAL